MPDDWSDSDDDGLEETSVLLGVPDGPVVDRADLADAAVSRIGGHPAFLPKHQPPLDDAKCSECAAQMELLLQIWCPFQDSPMDRALYVWACPMPRCQGKHGSVRAWRGLRFNAAYAAKLDRKKQREAQRAKVIAGPAKPPPPSHNPFSLGAQTQLPPNLFSAPQPTTPDNQCGANPDKDDTNGDSESGSESDSDASLVQALASTTLTDSPWSATPAYPALYLSTEEEYAPATSKKQQNPSLDPHDVDPSAWSAEKYENSLDTDRIFDRFSHRVSWRGEQCVRYELAGTPLPYANDKLFAMLWPKHTYNPSAVPQCPSCKTARVFECQLMPNMISVIAPVAETPANEEARKAAVAAALKKEAKGLDWGTVLIYSCPNDLCRDEWKEEVVYVWSDTV